MDILVQNPTLDKVPVSEWTVAGIIRDEIIKSVYTD